MEFFHSLIFFFYLSPTTTLSLNRWHPLVVDTLPPLHRVPGIYCKHTGVYISYLWLYRSRSTRMYLSLWSYLAGCGSWWLLRNNQFIYIKPQSIPAPTKCLLCPICFQCLMTATDLALSLLTSLYIFRVLWSWLIVKMMTKYLRTHFIEFMFPCLTAVSCFTVKRPAGGSEERWRKQENEKNAHFSRCAVSGYHVDTPISQ